MSRSSLLIAGLLCSALAACGNQTEISPVLGAITQAAKGATTKAKGPAAPPAEVTRADLAQLKVPVIKGELKSGNATFYLVPISVKGNVQTWSTSDKLTVTFRDSVMSETRGFGPDIMQSSGPTLAQLRSGNSTHRRSYVYLDGGDQLIRISYDCTARSAGPATVTVVGLQHSTTHVVETCTANGASFTNEYWFENGGKLRKSKELLVSEWGHLELARVIDGG
ncbi:YjbF family lipoprotein [Gemmobacter serpentinus]|uniref:YjbF family lipoprotein n=1 Tax=Gemmobacter serpentinus TaxID=2652247 RepID=UPI00124F492F|nr:YjbF family lipoprotein [Gemmobacter serpentinus]